MSSRLPITVRVPEFEGPLDLLLHLIQQHELDISKLALSKITDQYLLYVKCLQDQSFEIATEFLVMAATLILWKSKALLPRTDEDIAANNDDELSPLSPEDLVRQLLEHQKYLALGQRLGSRAKLGLDTFARPNGRPPVERVWREMNVTSIALGFQDLLTRARKRTHILRKETVSVAKQIQSFALRLEVGKIIELRSLMGVCPDRGEEVVTFLASLELTRLRKLRMFQQIVYSPIYVELLEKIESLDLGLIQAFEHEVREQTL